MSNHRNAGRSPSQAIAASTDSQTAKPTGAPLPGRFAQFRQLVWRAMRLKCCKCGQGRLFRGFFRMESRCSVCGFEYERESGFFLGSIYFNYGLTSLVTAILYPILRFGYGLPNFPVMAACVIFALLFPIWFFRYARALWLGFDQWIDPR